MQFDVYLHNTKKLNEFSKFWVSFQILIEYYSQTPRIISGIWPEFWNFAALTWADSGVKKQTSSKALIKTEILNPALSLTPPFTLLEHEKTRNIAFKNLLDVWIHAMIKQCTRSPKRLSYAKLKGWTKIQIWSQIFLFKTIFLDGVPLYFKTFLVIQVKKTPPSKWAICSKKPFSQKIQKKCSSHAPMQKKNFFCKAIS